MTPEDRPTLQDDDELVARLSAALDEHDPVPDDAIATARAALQLGRADVELAELVRDTLAATGELAMRSDALIEARALEFVAGGYRLDVELVDDGGVVLGQIDPADAARVALETEAGAQETEADLLGRFRFTGARGPLRLRITTTSGQVVLTPWITW
jgi:hypothetical protein